MENEESDEVKIEPKTEPENSDPAAEPTQAPVKSEPEPEIPNQKYDPSEPTEADQEMEVKMEDPAPPAEEMVKAPFFIGGTKLLYKIWPPK